MLDLTRPVPPYTSAAGETDLDETGRYQTPPVPVSNARA